MAEYRYRLVAPTPAPSKAPPDTLAVLRAVLDPAGDAAFSLLHPWIDDIDGLGHAERLALPLLHARWLAAGQPLAASQVLQGAHRKMIVKNRVLATECARVLARLRAAGIDAFAFKTCALLGRGLPERGLRVMSDIDLWVRPSQIVAARAALDRPGAAPRGSAHAVAVDLDHGIELDLHAVPTAFHTKRLRGRCAAEALFDAALTRAADGALCAPDLLYVSFLNIFFSQGCWGARATFALTELDTILRGPAFTDADLAEVGRRIASDGTAAVFLEHLEWLGSAAYLAAPGLARFRDFALAPTAEPRDWAVARWLVNGGASGGRTDTTRFWIDHHLRNRALLTRRVVEGRWPRIAAVVAGFGGMVRRDPGLLGVWLMRRSSWRRLHVLGRELLRRQAA